MTDTEILDYLDRSIELHQTWPRDCQMGAVFFTTGLKNGNPLRDLLRLAIARDMAVQVDQIARKLTP